MDGEQSTSRSEKGKGGAPEGGVRKRKDVGAACTGRPAGEGEESRMKRALILLTSMTCALIAGPMAGQANAGTVTVTWTGTSAEYGTRSAEAIFTMVDTGPDAPYLKITLHNTASEEDAPVEKPEQILTGVFFDLVQDLTLTRWKVVMPEGSTVIGPGIPDDGPPYVGPGGPLEVGGEYGFRDDLTTNEDPIENYPEGLGRSAVSAVGMEDAIGRWDVFPGPEYWSPAAPDGMAFGLISSLATTANNPLDDLPLVKDTVEFYLKVKDGLPPGYEFGVAKVDFNYGTDFNPVIIPLPLASLLGGAGLGALGLIGWWKRRRPQEAVA